MAIRGKRSVDNAPTIYDVARHAGVSHTTVSKVVNGISGDIAISQKTQDRVLRAIREMNYIPNSAARALATDRTRTLGVALYDIDYLKDRYFIDILGGVMQGAGIKDYNVQLATTTNQRDVSKQNLYFLKKAEERRFDGVIVIDQFVSEEDLIALVEKNFPLILVDRCLLKAPAYVVKADNFGGVQTAVRHLISRGHSVITFACEPVRHYKMQEMISGFKAAIAESEGVRGDYLEWPEDEDMRLETLRGLLTQPSRPTAIIFSYDADPNFIKAATEPLGIKFPGDLDVLVYGEFGRYTYSQVTSVRVPLREIGAKAAEMLISLIEGREPEAHVITLPVELLLSDQTS